MFVLFITRFVLGLSGLIVPVLIGCLYLLVRHPQEGSVPSHG